MTGEKCGLAAKDRQRLRAGVIGVGHLGRIHVDKYLALEGAELVGVADVDHERAEAIAAKTGVRAYADLQSLIEAVDLVSVVVPPESHFEVARACLLAGRHVLLEKPVTRTLAEAGDLIELARASGVVLQVGHLERFNPAIVAVRDAIHEPMFIESHRLAVFQPRGTEVNVVLDLMIHDIDIVLSLVPSPLCAVRPIGIPVLSDGTDIANVRLEFANGCVANLTASRVSQQKMRKMRIFQPDAYFSIDFLEQQVSVCRRGAPAADTAQGEIQVERRAVQPGDPLGDEIRAFVHAVRTGSAPVVTGEDGRRALAVALEITDGLYHVMLRVGIVAGETSGDLLGAGLLQALRERVGDVRAVGVGGPRMIAAGCDSLYPLQRLAVMGLFEVLARFRDLVEVRRQLRTHFLADRPDVFVGIDSPDFNLALEARLRRAGVPTVHYVSPQVWAWRESRLPKIARAVDLVLALFPFEAAYFERKGVPVCYVGHPLADAIPLVSDRAAARRELGLPPDQPIVALLPGSRRQEWHYHLEPFLRTAAWCHARRSALRFIVPAVGTAGQEAVREAVARIAPNLPVTVVQGRSPTVMTAADAVLTVSGTASLEAMLARRPMVVAYRLSSLSYALVRRMIRVEYCALPNLLAGERLVPEFIQSEVTPEKMGPAIIEWLSDAPAVAALEARFETLHRALRRDASRAAAGAVLQLLRR